jgi:hypothetical protein
MTIEVKIIKEFDKLRGVLDKLSNVTKIQKELKDEEFKIETKILELINANDLPTPFAVQHKSEILKVKIKTNSYSLSSKEIPDIEKKFTSSQIKKYFSLSKSISAKKSAIDEIVKNGAKAKADRLFIELINTKSKHTIKYDFVFELIK